MMEIVEVEKLSHNHVGLTEAYRRGLMLQEKGWMLFPAASWDEPAILAMEDGKCIAGVNWSLSTSTGAASVDFAWCSNEHPLALTKCLLRLRSRLRESPPTWLSFTCHRGNAPMEKLVAKMQLVPHSQTYRMPEAYYRRNREMLKPPKAGLLSRLWAAVRNTEAS